MRPSHCSLGARHTSTQFLAGCVSCVLSHRPFPQGWSCLASLSGSSTQRKLWGAERSLFILGWAHLDTMSAHRRCSVESVKWVNEGKASNARLSLMSVDTPGLPTSELLSYVGVVSCIFLFPGRGTFAFKKMQCWLLISNFTALWSEGLVCMSSTSWSLWCFLCDQIHDWFCECSLCPWEKGDSLLSECGVWHRGRVLWIMLFRPSISFLLFYLLAT